MSSRRKLNEVVFCKWTPKSAYLLGQFKAGANFSIYKNGTIHNIVINTTNLQHLIKMQLLLGSDHRIVYDNSNKRIHGGKASMRFHFGLSNKFVFQDLRRYGFIALGKCAPNAAAPFPRDIPKELTPHYIRGYFDERCTPMLNKNRSVLSISGITKEFLVELSNVIADEIGIPARTIYQKQGMKRKKARSYFMVYSGNDRIAKIFKYLYLFVPSSLYCVERYHRFSRILNLEEDYANIDVDLDVKSLYLLGCTTATASKNCR